MMITRPENFLDKTLETQIEEENRNMKNCIFVLGYSEMLLFLWYVYIWVWYVHRISKQAFGKFSFEMKNLTYYNIMNNGQMESD